jgi:hypothetical protein
MREEGWVEVKGRGRGRRREGGKEGEEGEEGEERTEEGEGEEEPGTGWGKIDE